jgi:hypothetical protein
MTNLLFDTLPRTRKRRIMMHVVDAGSDMVQLKCRRCGHDTGWVAESEPWYLDKRGRPCPTCNAETGR